MLGPHVRWFDDWFALEDIAPGVVAIGEPRFHYNNWNYLFIGETSALLFDTGPGVRDISRVVGALTDKPVTVLASHMHFDHTGNFHRFEDIAMPDLPILRAFENNGVFNCDEDLFLGHWVGQKWQPCKISRWWPIGYDIDIGGKALTILHTPGHSPDSISLLDSANNAVFIADYIYPSLLYVQVPGSSLADYEQTAAQLVETLDDDVALFGAHGTMDAESNHRAPKLGKSDLIDLQNSLISLRASGKQPATWPVNASISLGLAPHAFAAWQSPEDSI